MSLPIITSRDYRHSLRDLRTWLVYLQKITEHNEPFMPALMKVSTYITVHYRNDIHALSRCMEGVGKDEGLTGARFVLTNGVGRRSAAACGGGRRCRPLELRLR
jgi:hypothetical protein